MTEYRVDLTDDQAREFENEWPHDEHKRLTDTYSTAAYALADAIRANPPKPPRMDEPGWGKKVIAHTKRLPTRRPFIRWSDGSAWAWTSREDGSNCKPWDELIDPEPYRADA